MAVAVTVFTVVPLMALLTSAVYTLFVARRIGDWRPVLFVVLLVLMSVHQVNELRVFLDTGVASASRGFGEYPETGVNLLSSVAVFYILQFVRQERDLQQELSAKLDRERELRAQNEELTQFASIIGHDLRTPLQTASSRLSLVESDEDGEQVRAVQQSLDQMETVLDDALALAREQNTTPDTDELPVADVAAECWDVATDGSATLEIEQSFTVVGDEVRTRHVLENLFSNAVKHAGEDVTVTVGPLEDGVLYVEDDGKGIPDDHRDEVFELGHTTAADGSGFGLKIVQQLAESQGWTVRLIEGHDGGTRFEFRE